MSPARGPGLLKRSHSDWPTVVASCKAVPMYGITFPLKDVSAPRNLDGKARESSVLKPCQARQPATWSRANRAASSLFRYLPLRDKRGKRFCVAFSARYAHESPDSAVCCTHRERLSTNTTSYAKHGEFWCRTPSKIFDSHKAVFSEVYLITGADHMVRESALRQ